MNTECRPTENYPYQEFEGTPQWSLLNKALDELKNNSDLEEKTNREYILGYLCQALSSIKSDLSQFAEDQDRAVVHEVIAKTRESMRRANPDHRSLVDELIAERRTESLRA